MNAMVPLTKLLLLLLMALLLQLLPLPLQLLMAPQQNPQPAQLQDTTERSLH
jgi:hypothetical protein